MSDTEKLKILIEAIKIEKDQSKKVVSTSFNKLTVQQAQWRVKLMSGFLNRIGEK